MTPNRFVFVRFNLLSWMSFFLTALVYVSAAQAQSCFDYYSKNSHLGPSASRVNQMLNLDASEIEQAIAKLSNEDKKAVQSAKKRAEAIKIEVEKLDIPQEKAEELLAKGNLNQAHITVINNQKMMFTQHMALLENLTQRLNTDSQEINETMAIVNQVSLAVQVDLMQQMMKP